MSVQVRRFDRATGDECSPVSVKQAAWAIARAMSEKPLRCDVENIEADLLAGKEQATAGYVYTPDSWEGTPATYKPELSR